MEKKSTKPQVEKKRFKIGYGVRVPILPFESLIDILENAGNTVGFAGSLDDLSRIAGNTPTSSVFNKKLAALKNFSLVIVAGDGFEITELGQRIVNPTSPEQRADALLEAFLKLEIHRVIYERYKGKLLPERTFLANYINKELDIPFELKSDWAAYFTSAASYTGILHKRDSGSYQVMARPWSANSDKVDMSRPNGGDSNGNDDTSRDEPDDQKQQILQGGIIETSQWGILSQRKVSGNRKAVFAIPDELTENDISTLKVIIDGIMASLEGLRIPSSQED